ncbi:hypothetical protein [Paenibacillus apiarius]|uniref:Uncharacterized protein n=1 Tax=Paenibacillus apiarius TaxID=46240 RepID=A0ABT4DXQ2_9BACL|nr:hypothetical protein [Paenibacillus apiarius]MBN3523376.1 hypothetical protein [Paenibacillus apiarius]MCY9514404.1 hypothetical protein [Paenibacillus apiarius]MCY9521058.1 hypothetical protein [Paenibacillus apiarius]MCY9551905.1 hypothetical protein [Paenibacillus apiarius]MCY9557792.1 hypothetical protein [Paenibacillus apiarius]
MDQTTKNGPKKLEKTMKTRNFTRDDKSKPHAETIKSEKLRSENADRIYE